MDISRIIFDDKIENLLKQFAGPSHITLRDEYDYVDGWFRVTDDPQAMITYQGEPVAISDTLGLSFHITDFQ